MSQVMIITGTRKGIGRALAEAYAAEGYSVYGCSRRPADLQHPNYTHRQVDVTDEAAVMAFVREVRRTAGAIDVLINNTGIGSMNHSILTPTATVRKLMETNFIGSFTFCRECAKMMMHRGSGRIVNFSSVAVPLRLEGEMAYAASKAAIEHMTRVMAKETGADGVTINTIGPAPVETDLIRHVGEDRIARLIDHQSIKRCAMFEDVKNVIDFFISPRSEMITGQTIYLGGIS